MKDSKEDRGRNLETMQARRQWIKYLKESENSQTRMLNSGNYCS